MEEAEGVLPGLFVDAESWRPVLLGLRRGRAQPSAEPPVSEARGRIAGERKFLTVLCADLQRSTDLISELDPEAAISRLEPALIAMRTAVRRNRGIVSKEGGDGLIALFGAPHADDNHAVMACHAAIELVRRIKLLEDPALHVRVGVHSGYVVAHVIEADFSSIYEAGGPAVHLVKRLENAAQAGQILVSESCQEPGARARDLQCPAAETAGGISRAGALLRARRDQRPDAAGGARSTRRAFLLRRPQRKRFRSWSARRRTSALPGRSLRWWARPGSENPAWPTNLSATLRQQNWQVLEAECNPLEQAVPYALLKKLLQSALQADNLTPADGLGSREGRRRRTPIFGPRHFDSVLDQPVGDPRWGDLEPLLRRRVIIDAVRNVIDRVVSTRPTVLLLEDLHWIDGQSETVIEALMSLAASRPLLVLLTWRTEYTPGWLARLDVRGSGCGRSTPPRPMRCSTICSARPPISMRSRPIFFAIPARSRSLSRRSPGSSSIAASRWPAAGFEGLLGRARNSSHRSGRDRVAHRSSVERRQGASAARLRSRTADFAASAGRCDRHAGGAIAKPALVAGDPGLP